MGKMLVTRTVTELIHPMIILYDEQALTNIVNSHGKRSTQLRAKSRRRAQPEAHP